MRVWRPNGSNTGCSPRSQISARYSSLWQTDRLAEAPYSMVWLAFESQIEGRQQYNSRKVRSACSHSLRHGVAGMHDGQILNPRCPISILRVSRRGGGIMTNANSQPDDAMSDLGCTHQRKPVQNGVAGLASPQPVVFFERMKKREMLMLSGETIQGERRRPVKTQLFHAWPARNPEWSGFEMQPISRAVSGSS